MNYDEKMIEFSKLFAGEPEFIPLLNEDDTLDFGIKD